MSDPRDIGTDHTSIRTAASPVAPGPFQPPPSIGPFRLQRLLGRGGMAAVYLAHEEASGRVVAVKLMDPNLKGDPTFIERFLNEAKATASLHHPNVVEMLSHGESEGWYFIATEFVDGGTVAQLIERMGSLPAAVATELFAQLMAGLAYAHSAGIVHRDLKPENLLLTAGGILKVGDFGIARTLDHQKLTKTGMLVGTAGYMSPEQARGDTVDHQSDLFTSGIILFEMLTGKNPFGGDSAAASITRILAAQPPSLFEALPTAPPELEQLVDHLLANKPGERPSSASEVFEQLLKLVAARRSAHPTLLAECLKRPTDMRRSLDAEAAAALVAEAQTLMGGGQLEKNRAAFKLHFARLLDGKNSEAATQLQSLSQAMGLRFGPPHNPKIVELEHTLATAPGAPAVLQQLAQLYKLEGNLLQSALYVKKYLKVKPGDAYAANQLFQLTGERLTTAAPVGESTRELMAGVKTGGFKAARAGPTTRLIAPPAAAAGQLTVVDVEARNPLVGLAIKAGVAAVVLGAAVFGFRKVSAAIDRATAETDRATVDLRRGIDTTPPPTTNPVLPRRPAPPPGPTPEQAADDAYGKVLSQRAEGANDDAVLAGFDEVMQRWPDSAAAVRAQLERARTLLSLRRNSEAQDALSTFLRAHPTHPLANEALLLRAEACAQNLADDDALADLDEHLKQAPTGPLAGQALLWRAEVKARHRDATARRDFTDARAALEADDPLQARVTAGLAALDAAQ